MAIENAWRVSLLICQMVFYNRALKTQKADLMEMCVDFMVKENRVRRGCSASSPDFLWDSCTLVKLSPELVTAMKGLCYLYISTMVLNPDAMVTPEGPVSRKHGCFII